MDWREDSEYETENARQELSTRAARVYRYTNCTIKVASEVLPLYMFRKSKRRLLKDRYFDPFKSLISTINLSRLNLD